MAKTAKAGKAGKRTEADDFKSVAKRLECDPSEEKFDRALREIGKRPRAAKSLLDRKP